MASLTENERRVLEAIQDGLPIETEPYRAIASSIGMAEEQVIQLISAMLASGKIKRIGAVPNHYALGITANGMSVWDIPDELATEIGRLSLVLQQARGSSSEASRRITEKDLGGFAEAAPAITASIPVVGAPPPSPRRSETTSVGIVRNMKREEYVVLRSD